MTLPLRDLEALTDRLKAISDRYERVYNINRSGDWHMLKIQEEVGELTQSYLALTGRSRRPDDNAKADLANEMADVVCMVLLMARDQGIDINEAITHKWLKWEAVMHQEAPHEHA